MYLRRLLNPELALRVPESAGPPDHLRRRVVGSLEIGGHLVSSLNVADGVVRSSSSVSNVEDVHGVVNVVDEVRGVVNARGLVVDGIAADDPGDRFGVRFGVGKAIGSEGQK